MFFTSCFSSVKRTVISSLISTAVPVKRNAETLSWERSLLFRTDPRITGYAAAFVSSFGSKKRDFVRMPAQEQFHSHAFGKSQNLFAGFSVITRKIQRESDVANADHVSDLRIVRDPAFFHGGQPFDFFFSVFVKRCRNETEERAFYAKCVRTLRKRRFL